MKFQYQVYGLPLFSEIELPSLVGIGDVELSNPIKVSLGKVPLALVSEPNETKPFSTYNENEFLFDLPNVAKYYVSNGNAIVIEPIGENWEEILLHLYANGISAALYQRNLLPFHVSGVFVNENKVLLFAAPSRTGKSTTALMLQQKGYAPFTDDTAILKVKNGKCYAQASYPMARLWQQTIENQHQYAEENKRVLFEETEKYGFSFHETFNPKMVEVLGFIFLEEAGLEIQIDKLTPTNSLEYFTNNIYRYQWVKGMKKQRLQFEHISTIINAVPSYLARRPKNRNTFESFAEAIETEIVKKIEN